MLSGQIDGWVGKQGRGGPGSVDRRVLRPRQARSERRQGKGMLLLLPLPATNFLPVLSHQLESGDLSRHFLSLTLKLAVRHTMNFLLRLRTYVLFVRTLDYFYGLAVLVGMFPV